ncbi:MAG: hypothetical protein D6820_07175 [Lentisphaerae bacterium]|nr:MAG: hypothetical protein D6820_07175 [Lentisphaerota bacterium]
MRRPLFFNQLRLFCRKDDSPTICKEKRIDSGGEYALWKYILLSAFALLITIRAPQLVWPGRFWAEEGTLFFARCYLLPIPDFIFSIELGYYNLYPKLAALSAVYLVPMEYAACIMALWSLAGMLIPAWLLLFSARETRFLNIFTILSLLSILLIQPNQEVWLNTVNSQFYFCLATAIILITKPVNRMMLGIRLAVLATAGLTGVISCLLLPLFWLEVALTRDRDRLSEALVLSIVSGLQVASILIAGGRETTCYFTLLPWALLIKQWVLPYLGMEMADQLGNVIIQNRLWFHMTFTMLALIPYLLVTGILILSKKDRYACYLAAASLFIACISFCKSVEALPTGSILSHLSSLGGSRYYFVPNVLMAMALLRTSGIGEKQTWPGMQRVWHLFCVTLVSVSLLVGAANFFCHHKIQPFFSGPSWPEEVRRWRNNESDTLHIWPPPWKMHILKKTDTTILRPTE